MFDSNGDITPPCGVPFPFGLLCTPFGSTLLDFSHCRMSDSTPLSVMRVRRARNSLSCGIVSK